MKGLAETLRDFVSLFDRLGLSYAVMGGLAVRVYGIPRPTYDVDFTVAIARERLPELYRAITDAGYTVPEPYESGWIDQIAGMPVVKSRFYFEGTAIDVDIFLAESAYQESLMSRRARHPLDDRLVWLVSPEDLILLKLIAHRPRDLADIGDVLFMQGQVDESYLRRWAATLGVAAGLEEALRAVTFESNSRFDVMDRAETEALLFRFVGRYSKKPDSTSLTEEERVIELVLAFELQVCNGGFDQFLVNPSGDRWHPTLVALKRIGATKIVTMLEKALTIFPNGQPSMDQMTRCGQLVVAGPAADKLLQELTDEYYGLWKSSPDQDSYARMGAFLLECGLIQCGSQ